MARAISDEELQLKKRARRRLVGAIVLVTAVAVILPMVLDSEPRPVNQNVDIQIPSPDSGEFKPKSAAPVAALATPPAAKSAPPSAAVSGAPLRGMPPTVAAPHKDAQASAGTADVKPAV